jgi:hypothetical protein
MLYTFYTSATLSAALFADENTKYARLNQAMHSFANESINYESQA